MTKIRIKSIKVHRKPRKFTKATQFLLDNIFKTHGGIIKTAEKLGFDYQLLSQWRWDGKVPLKHVGRTSVILNVPQFALNYEDVVELTRKEIEFKDVLEALNLSDETKKFIGGHKAPREAKEILSV